MNRKIRKTLCMAMVLCIAFFLQGCAKKPVETMDTIQKSETPQDTKEDTVKESEPEVETKEETMPETTEELKIENSGIAYPSVSGALSVTGTQLVDSNGTAVQLRGISTHGIAWFPDYINDDFFNELREDWKVNVIRLAMYTAENGGFCNGGDQEKLRTLVQNGVEYATDNDMYVIIDWHILSDNNPNNYKKEAKEFFDEMSLAYADYNNVIYEICNEPNGGTSWSDIKSYAVEVIEVIRNNDEDGIILVGTPNWSQFVDQAAADPITEYDNIMYTLHFYAATHTEGLRNTMTGAIKAGLPIFVSEYGICDASGNGGIDENQANQWVSTMDTWGVSYVAWNISNKNETSAIFNSSCNKVSGFTQDDLSSSGKWLFKLLTGETAPVPAQPKNPSDLSEKPQNTGQGDSGKETPSGTEIVAKSGTIEYTAVCTGSWESEGKTFYQYDLALQSDSACTKWEIEITFSDSISFSDGWNGDYLADGKVLKITSKDYNGSISEGESISDIGFIISGPSGMEIVK